MSITPLKRAFSVAIAAVGFTFSLGLPPAATGGQEHSAIPADEPGFQSLFNGKDLTGWDGDPRLWSVSNGEITGRIAEDSYIPKLNSFLIWTNGLVDDFELRVSYRMPTNMPGNLANSGIQYRSKIVDPTNWVVGGYQADMEQGHRYSGNLYDEAGVAGGRRVMGRRGEKVIWTRDCRKQPDGSIDSPDATEAVIRPGDWNEYVVVARGNHLQQFINGRQTVDVTDDCEEFRLASGVLAFQLQGNRVMTIQFKDIRLKQFK